MNWLCRIISPQPARREELQAFHTSVYLDCLATANEYASSDEIADDSFLEDLEQYGIGKVYTFSYTAYHNSSTAYDCPLFKKIYDYCSLIAGASITAADYLIQKKAAVAINWYGGWHHAGK